MRLRSHSGSANWSVWLMVAAWFCANVSSTTTLHLSAWFKGAQHFSHYAALRQSVSSLLANGHCPPASRFAASADTHRTLPPAVPSGEEPKKIDFTLPSGRLRLIAVLPAAARPMLEIIAPDEPVIEVPYPPPRTVGLA